MRFFKTKRKKPSDDELFSPRERACTREKCCLYMDPEADKKAWHQLSTVPEEISLCLTEGEPILFIRTITGTEYGPGKIGLESNCKTISIPPELRGQLYVTKVQEWIETLREPFGPEIIWTDEYLRYALQEWCGNANQVTYQKAPEGFYSILNPFEFLDCVGPDGLDDKSGISHWVRIKKGLLARDAVPALKAFEHSGILVVLEDDPKLPAGISAKEMKQNRVWFGFLTGKDSIRDLVTEKEYLVRYHEWPGSADDAATYGEWWLMEC